MHFDGLVWWKVGLSFSRELNEFQTKKGKKHSCFAKIRYSRDIGSKLAFLLKEHPQGWMIILLLFGSARGRWMDERLRWFCHG
jgi:hypothetical protein